MGRECGEMSGGGHQADMRECLRKISKLTFAHRVVFLGEQADIVREAEEPLEEMQLFGHHANQAFDLLGLLPDILAEQPDLATTGLQQAREHFDRGRLARSVGSEKAKKGALRDLQIEILNRLKVAKMAIQLAGFDTQGVFREAHENSIAAGGGRRDEWTEELLEYDPVKLTLKII